MQTSPELLEDSRYSQVSATAVVALLLGLASLSAFIGPLFFVLPAAAVGTGLLALSKIRSSEGGLTGQTLARIGIALGIGCLAASLVRESVRDTLLQRQAVEASKEWLELLADGHIEKARQLLTRNAEGIFVPSPVQMGEQPASAEEIEQMIVSGLSSQELTKAVEGQSDPGLFESVSGPAFDGPNATVLVTYAVDDATENGHRHVGIQMIRHPAYEVDGRPWRVDRWQTGEAHGAH